MKRSEPRAKKSPAERCCSTRAFADDLPLLFDFLGVPDPERPPPQLSGEARQRALRGIVCRLVSTPARRHTIVIVVEDLHWIDDGSEAMLADLVERGRRHPDARRGQLPPRVHALVEAAAVPTAASPWTRWSQPTPASCCATSPARTPRWTGSRSRSTSAPPVTPSSSRRSSASWPRPGGCEGERGAYRLAGSVDDAGVPASVQAILAARIDRLDPAAKDLLQTASVLGKEFGERALRLSAGVEPGELKAPLCALTESGFLYEAEIYPERVLVFRHPLTREVAYGSQLGERRAATHAAVARATIELEPTGSTSWRRWSPTTGRRAARRWRLRAGTPALPTGPATDAPRTRCASGSG